jgi:hypothetical protein
MSECPFESDVLDALASRRWPARAGEELRAHVAACPGCADLAAVAGALLIEEDAAYAEARVPAPAVVWHRAQLRAREEAVRAATRPIGFVQGVAFACGVAAVIAAAVWGLPLLPDAAGLWSRSAPSLSLPNVDIDAMALLSNTAVQIAAAGSALLASAALYFTLRDINS